ncbi:MAG: DUF362 domain-containing protein [Deltaproteobacteria bacterium]|nr:DUF362 domain-containing protein [Deltaproteobacteria bacterium]
MDRRKFISVGIGAAAAGAVAAGVKAVLDGTEANGAPRGGAPRRPVVAVVRAGSAKSPADLVRALYRRLVERAILLATGASGLREAVLGVASPSEMVGFKLNLLAGPRLSPSPEMAAALAGVFAAAGFSRERLVLWERTRAELRRCGYSQDLGATVAATDDPGAGYEDEPESSGELGSCFSRLLTRRLDVLVSVGVCKDHDLSGVSCGAKNLYGVIHNPNKYHDQNCDPYIPDLLASRPVKKALRLTVLDAATVQYDGGPLYSEATNAFFGGVIAGRDMIAVDSVARSVIERLRKEHGLKTLKETGREPTWLATAERRGLGVADPARIKVVEETV